MCRKKRNAGALAGVEKTGKNRRGSGKPGEVSHVLPRPLQRGKAVIEKRILKSRGQKGKNEKNLERKGCNQLAGCSHASTQ